MLRDYQTRSMDQLYEPPKWLKKQPKPFLELINKISNEEIYAIIIEAANNAASLAFEQTYEALINLASEPPVKEKKIINVSNNIPEVLLELKNIFQDSCFTSQQFLNYLKENPQKKDWFIERTGGACRAANVFGGFLGTILKKQKNETIKIEKNGYSSSNGSLGSLWRITNAS